MCAGTPIASPSSWQSVRMYVPSLQAMRKRAVFGGSTPKRVKPYTVTARARRSTTFPSTRELVEALSGVPHGGEHRRLLRDLADETR